MQGKKEQFSKIETVVSLIISGLVSALFLINSPLHPWVRGASGVDSSVFKTIAFMMDKGYMPYRDTFDHKGPFLYLINYLGNNISYYSGTWIIELISLIITVFFVYRIARLSCKSVSSVIVTFASMTILFDYFQNGNFTEEYAMPCVAFALMVFLDYLIDGYITRLRIVLAGIGLGIVLMLRPNMIAVWIVFCVSVLIKLLIEKDYKFLWTVLFFLC